MTTTDDRKTSHWVVIWLFLIAVNLVLDTLHMERIDRNVEALKSRIAVLEARK